MDFHKNTNINTNIANRSIYIPTIGSILVSRKCLICPKDRCVLSMVFQRYSMVDSVSDAELLSEAPSEKSPSPEFIHPIAIWTTLPVMLFKSCIIDRVFKKHIAYHRHLDDGCGVFYFLNILVFPRTCNSK
jgi:hypothetical protein